MVGALAMQHVGPDVDVVAPVDAMKQLFKMPYSNGPLSIAVHSIGHTLVLDTVEPGTTPQAVLGALGAASSSTATAAGIKPGSYVRKQELFSKFLYRTLLPPPGASSSRGGDPVAEAAAHVPEGAQARDGRGGEHVPDAAAGTQAAESGTQAAAAAGAGQGADGAVAGAGAGVASDEAGGHVVAPSIPKPKTLDVATPIVSHPSDDDTRASAAGTAATAAAGTQGGIAEKPGPAHSTWMPGGTPHVRSFRQVSRWGFTGMNMVLGSDLIIFGNKDHERVSLQLQDVDDQPMSQADGLDMFLDNVVRARAWLCYSCGRWAPEAASKISCVPLGMCVTHTTLADCGGTDGQRARGCHVLPQGGCGEGLPPGTDPGNS